MTQKFKIKNICCIGAGYVGGPTMSVIAKNCPHIEVSVVDINKERIALWNDANLDNLPVYEPGLKKVIQLCRNKNLHFSTNVDEAISKADMIFISVNTPTKKKGIGAGQASDLKWVEASTRRIANYSKGKTIIVEKSTLPVKTAETIKTILDSYKKNFVVNEENEEKEFYVLSSPEFLAEGTAINDLENPDRVLIGGDNNNAINALEEIYLNWVKKEKILKTNLWSSELSKLTANAFLAQRISSINSISAICEETGADVNEVSKAIGMDRRIGSKFLNTGPGFGGSCFKKDILNLIYLSNYFSLGEVASYWGKVLEINQWQQKRISKIIIKKLFGNLYEKKLSILGFAFKANTNDTRESPAIKICNDLLEEGAYLSIYDPKVELKQVQNDLFCNENQNISKITIANTAEDSAKNADAIVVLTEWEEFKNLNWHKISKSMRNPSWVFDTRGILNLKELKSSGMNIWRVGASIDKDN